MKYEKELYENTEFYGMEEEIENHQQKIVKCRKPHKCVDCQDMIIIGEQALRETGFLEGMPVSAYTCISCCDKWLDELKEEEAI